MKHLTKMALGLAVSVGIMGLGFPAWGIELQTVVVSPGAVQTPSFHEGESLGEGIVEKTFTSEEQKRPVIQSPKKHVIAQHDKKTKVDRSIASYPEDSKLSNDVITQVRNKDSKDYDESLAIVRAAIERGEYGHAAKEKLKNQK